MSLFVCQKCRVVENTALCLYWGKGENPPLCSACDKRIGKWHNAFPKQYFNEKEWEKDYGDFVKRI